MEWLIGHAEEILEIAGGIEWEYQTYRSTPRPFEKGLFGTLPRGDDEGTFVGDEVFLVLGKSGNEEESRVGILPRGPVWGGGRE